MCCSSPGILGVQHLIVVRWCGDAVLRDAPALHAQRRGAVWREENVVLELLENELKLSYVEYIIQYQNFKIVQF